MKRLLFAVVLAACSSKSPQTSPPPVPPPPTPVDNGSGSMPQADPLADKNPKIGEKCGAGDSCAKGLTCVSYYGIAGAKGPQFKTCEAKCDKGQACPVGTKCATIADGPGQVCR